MHIFKNFLLLVLFLYKLWILAHIFSHGQDSIIEMNLSHVRCFMNVWISKQIHRETVLPTLLYSLYF